MPAEVLEHVPLDLPALRRILKHGAPGTEGLSKKTLQNLHSNLGAAIEASGLRRCSGPPVSGWHPHGWRCMEDDRQEGPRTTLSRLARFCSAKGIAPMAVDDAVFAEFRIYLELETLARDPAKSYAKAIWGWNTACATVPGFPGSPVTALRVGRVAKRHSFRELPASFAADLEAHLDWAAVTDPFDPNARSGR